MRNIPSARIIWFWLKQYFWTVFKICSDILPWNSTPDYPFTLTIWNKEFKNEEKKLKTREKCDYLCILRFSRSKTRYFVKFCDSRLLTFITNLPKHTIPLSKWPKFELLFHPIREKDENFPKYHHKIKVCTKYHHLS